MKKLRGLLCILLALCLLPGRAEAADYTSTGTCGESLTYTVADGVLTISGTGEMDDYYYAYEGGPDVPGWDPQSFRKIVIEEGITSIGAYAFSYANGSPVTSVHLPDTLERIGEGAFQGCDKLTAIHLPQNLRYIGGAAFYGCTALSEINIPEDIETLGTIVLDGTAIAQPSAWAKAEVDEARGLGFIPEDCSYSYRRDITREQIATMAVYMLEAAGAGPGQPDEGISFTDTDDWYLLRAASAGIVDGVGNGRFAPKEKATREQIAAILCRAAAYIEAELDLTLLDRTAKLPDTYTDKSQVSAWAADDLAALVKGGVMGGTSASTLSPKSNTTIEEAVALMLRLLKLSYTAPARHPAGAQGQLDRKNVASADFEIAQGIMAPNLGRAEASPEMLDKLVAAYNRACETAIRYDPDPGDTVRSFSNWVTLHMTDGTDLSLCCRGTGEVRVWGDNGMILRSLELYQLLRECIASGTQ